MSRGFFTFAQNSGKNDFVKMAYGLALSLKLTQNNTTSLSIGITSGQEVSDKYREVFDKVVEMPWGDDAKDDEWKLRNEWKAYYMSPYDNTIKLAADMLFFEDVSYWWDQCRNHNFRITDRVYTYRKQLITSDSQRKVFTLNNLPNVYSDVTYFNKSEECEEIFFLLRKILRRWEDFYMTFMTGRSRPKYLSTDVSYALALQILDYNYSNPEYKNHLTFTHMKPQLLDIGNVDIWSELLRVDFLPNCTCRIGNYNQTLPLHYHEKWFLTDEIISTYEKELGI